MEKSVSLSTGVRMQYVEQGRPDGIPVVFLHGVTDSWHSFEGVLRLLPPDVRAFAVSQRGHGDSSRPETGYRYSDLAGDVLAFLDAIGLPRPIIVGHSMGALVTQRFVIDHPDRVSGLVLMGAFPTLYRDSGLTEFYASGIAPLADPVSPTFAREWQQSTLARPIPPPFMNTAVSETIKVPARLWHELFTGFLETPDFSDDLARVTVPALIAWGDRDTYAPRAAQDRLLAVMPRATLVVYEGAGHAFHWEDPAQFTTDLLKFVHHAHPNPGFD